MAKTKHKQTAETAIRVSGVSKDFALPHEKVNSMKSYFTKLFNMNRTVEVQHALRDISFEIKKGEFFGIVGRNGSGKSTLLKLLAGIYQPTKGEVHVNGKLVPFIELGVGFNPELTGRENVYLNGALLGFSKKEMDDQYDDIVAFAELEDFMDQKLKNYSSGMQVRLAFSVAICAKADVLLIDEVLAVGDADFKRKCYNYFKSLRNNDTTVVFVTHEMDAVREYCDRALLIDEGVIAHLEAAGRISDEYLKLFNKSKSDSTESINESETRWGSGQVRFEHIAVKNKDNSVRIGMRIRAKEATEGVVVGVRVQDSDGHTLAGVNSLTVTNGHELSFRKGVTREVGFSLEDIFGKGTFTVSATIRLMDKITVFDNWDNAATFSSMRDEAYYPIVCPATLELPDK